MLSIFSVYTPFNENQASSGGQTFLFALLNALIVLCIVIVMTVVLVLLFKYRCYRVRNVQYTCIYIPFYTCSCTVHTCIICMYSMSFFYELRT